MKILEIKSELMKKLASCSNLPLKGQSEFLRIVWNLKCYASNREGIFPCRLSYFDSVFLKNEGLDCIKSCFASKNYRVHEITKEDFQDVILSFEKNKNCIVHNYTDQKVIFEKIINAILNSVAHNQCFFSKNRFIFWNLGNGKVMLVGTMKLKNLKMVFDFLNSNYEKIRN